MNTKIQSPRITRLLKLLQEQNERMIENPHVVSGLFHNHFIKKGEISGIYIVKGIHLRWILKLCIVYNIDKFYRFFLYGKFKKK